jgi:hypothetical protein
MPAREGEGVGSPAKALTLGEVVRFGLSHYAQHHRLPRYHWTALNAIGACRTIALGGHRYCCQSCGREHAAFHSCRNRHCPTCQGVNSIDWLTKQQAALLPVSYFHVVFTLPHCLNPLIEQNQALCYHLLFQSASETLLAFGRNNLGVQLGLTAVLHTWSQTLLGHYHLHCIVAGGGISLDGRRWLSTARNYLFPVTALSTVFRAKFRDGLQTAYREKEFKFEGALQTLGQRANFQAMIRQAVATGWVVYTKEPFGGPDQVLAYLARYTHRVGISNHRLLELNHSDRTIRFRWKDYAHGSSHKQMTLTVDEFIRRLRLHILPARFVKIRHYGFLSNRNRLAKVKLARTLLNVPPPEESLAAQPPPKPVLDERLRCPFCGQKTLVLIETMGPYRPVRFPDTS